MMNSLFGLRLHTAGMVVGWIGAVLSFIALVIFAVALGNLEELTNAITSKMDPNADPEMVRLAIVVVATFYLIINGINLCASALLIVGTLKERHLMIVPWLLNSGVALVINAIYLFSVVIMSFSSKSPFGPVAFSIIIGCLSWAIQFYIWSAIYSLYKKIQATRDQQQTLLPTAGSSSPYPVYTKI